MANNIEQALIAELRALRADLLKAVNANKYRSKEDEKYARRDNSIRNDDSFSHEKDEIINAFKSQTTAINDSKNNLGKFSKEILSQALPTMKILTQGFGSAKDALKEYTKYSNDQLKKSADDTFDIFAKIVKSGRNFDTAFDDLFKSQQKLRKAIDDAIDDPTSKNKIRASHAKKIKEAHDELKSYGMSNEALGNLNIEDVKNRKIGIKQLKDYNKGLGDVIAGTLKGGKAAANVLPEMMQTVRGTFIKSIATILVDVGPKIIDQLTKDYKANRFYGVGGTTYTSNLSNNIGMSEQERSQLVGKNLQTFQLLGKGNANAPFENGEFSQLQNNMLKNFGIYGKDAAEEIAKNMNIVFSSGFKVSTDNLKEFGDNLAAASRIAGEAPDVMQGFYKELGDTGQIALLRQSMQGKTDKEQMDAIMQNTAIMFKVNKNLGMTAEEIRKQNQMAFNASHADFLQTVMQGVGTNMAASQLKKANPGDTRSQGQIADLLAYAQMSPDQQEYALNTKFQGQNKQDVMQAAYGYLKNAQGLGEKNRIQGIQNGLAQGQSLVNAGITGAGGQLPQEIGRRFNSLVFSPSGIESAQNYGISARGAANDTAGQPITTSLDAMKKAIGDESSGVIESLIKMRTWLDTFQGNPITQGAGAVFGAAASWSIMKGLGKLITGKGGGVLGRLLGAGATTAETAAGGEAVAGTAAAAGGTGLLATGAALIGSGLAGWGIGTGINKLWDSSKVGSKANDAIFAIASSPLEAVAMKFRAMADPSFAMFLNSLSDKQIDDAVTKRALEQNPALAAQIEQMKNRKFAPKPSAAPTSAASSATPNATATSSSASPLTSNLSGNDKATAIMQRLMNETGMSKESAAALVGNMRFESGNFKELQEIGKSGVNSGYGWAQWTGSRRTDFLNYAQKLGLDPSSDEANYQFLKYETTQGDYKNTIAKMQGMTLPDATRIALKEYENPADTWSTYNQRLSYAKQAYDNVNTPQITAFSQTGNTDPNQQKQFNDLLNVIIDGLSSIGIKIDKGNDISSKHLDETKKVNKFDPELSALGNRNRMKNIAQNANQTISNTLASYGAKPS